MTQPDWRNFILHDDVLREPMVDEQHIALWLPGNRDPDVQHWERIASVARADIAVDQGICAIAATAICARQRLCGWFGRLWQRFQNASAGPVWTLPNGEAVEQSRPRRTDLLLVWAEDAAQPFDETRIKSRWPQASRVQQLGANLFVVAGVEPSAARAPAAETSSQGCPRGEAEQAVTAARKTGDPRRLVPALTDLGIVCLREGEVPRAVALLEEALGLTRQLADQSSERDVQGNLGLAFLALGEPQRAWELFQQELTHARMASDPFAEKTALQHLGHAFMHLQNFLQAHAFLEQALQLARRLGDRQHEAELLWDLGILHAEQNQPEQAIPWGKATVELLEQLGKPQARWYAEHVERYRRGETESGLNGTGRGGARLAPGIFRGEVIVASGWIPPPILTPASATPTRGPGLLRMAVSAVKAMAEFVGSGFKRVAPEIHQRRLRACRTCEQHTGLRCRVCGCFTNAKAWMRHEDCPIGKWPR